MIRIFFFSILLSAFFSCSLPGRISGDKIIKDGLQTAINKQIAKQKGKHITISLPKNIYQFHEKDGSKRELYISNYDRDNPKTVGLYFKGLKNVTMDGNGSELVFHGRMLPIVFEDGENITIKNFSIDFALPTCANSKLFR